MKIKLKDYTSQTQLKNLALRACEILEPLLGQKFEVNLRLTSLYGSSMSPEFKIEYIDTSGRAVVFHAICHDHTHYFFYDVIDALKEWCTLDAYVLTEEMADARDKIKTCLHDTAYVEGLYQEYLIEIAEAHFYGS
jgi:hypothetical protein